MSNVESHSSPCTFSSQPTITEPTTNYYSYSDRLEPNDTTQQPFQKPHHVASSQRSSEAIVLQAQELERRSKQSKEEQDEEKACLQAFGFSDYRQHKNRNPLRVPDTCRWVLENEQFLDWRSSANDAPGLLWISADPGCGKSVLARSLIDENLLHPRKSTPRIVCYFFFKYGISEQQGGAACIRAILRQMFQRQPFLIKYALPEYRRIGSNMTESFEALWGIFRDTTSDPNILNTVCLIDALDECDETSRFELIDRLKEMYSAEGTSEPASSLKILVTSRPYEEIDRRFRTLTNIFPTIRLKGEEESKIISQEINLVTEDVVPRIALELNLPGNVEKTLVDRLLSIPNRTYLWLHLILDEVRKSLGASTPQRMLKIVETLPETVDAAYDAILDRSTDATLARRLLHILVCATRDLSLDELNVALHIKHGMRNIEELDLEANEYFQITVRNLCGLFINVIDSKIYFIHQTAREYLLRSYDCQDQAWGRWRRSLDPDVSHAILAECCIIYLHFDVFRSQRPLTLRDSRSRQFLDADGSHLNRDVRKFTRPLDTKQFAFLDYSALNWTYHYEEGLGEARIADMAFELCNPESEYFLSWFNIYRTEGNFIAGSDMFPMNCSHLMIACAFGFSDMARQLLPDKDRLDAIDEVADHLSPLSLAVWSGHHAAVRLLLRLKPDLQSSNVTDIRSSPLCLSVEQGDLETVRLLLECDFPVNQAVRNKAPLERMIQRINMEDMFDIFKLLLQYGADLNPPDRPSALQYAAENDDYETVAILVNNNSDVNHSISSDSSVPPPALCSAAKHGNLPMMRTLLDAGADVNIQDTRSNYSGSTPLYNAVKYEHDQAVSLLLSQEGIKVDAGSGNYGTPLFCATYNGDITLMEQLLKAGADPNKSDGKRAPLAIAAARNDPSATEMLLSFGAEVYLDGQELASESLPLSTAARAGKLQTLKILLDHGADPSMTWSDGQKSVFTSAVEGNHLHIVRHLLEYNPSKTQDLAPLALSAAIESTPKMLDLVLSYYPASILSSLPVESRYFYTAVTRNHLPTMRLILENSANTTELLTQAFMAALDGTVNMLQLALSHYPDITLEVVNGGLAYLKMAPEKAYKEIFGVSMRGEMEYNERLEKYRARANEIGKMEQILKSKRREWVGLSGVFGSARSVVGPHKEAEDTGDISDVSSLSDGDEGVDKSGLIPSALTMTGLVTEGFTRSCQVREWNS